MGRFRLPITISLAVLLSLLVQCSIGKDSPSSAVEKLCRLVNEGKRSEARKYFSSRSQEQFDKGLYEQISEMVTQNGKMEAAKAREEKIEGNKAAVLVAVTVAGEFRPKLFCPKLVFEDDAWHVEDFRFQGQVIRTTALAITPGGHLLAGGDEGVFLSADNGTNWTAANTGLTNISVSSFIVNGTNLFAGTGGGVFLSTNGGTSWAEVDSGLTNTGVLALAISGTHLFAGTYRGVFASSDNGNGWSSTELRDTHGRIPVIKALAASSSGLVFAGSDGALFRSADNGSSWSPVFTRLTSELSTDFLSLAVNSSGYIFAGIGTRGFTSSELGGVFRSTDGGRSWSRVGLGGYDVIALVINSSGRIFAATPTRGNTLSREGMFVSTDNGISWNKVDLDGVLSLALNKNADIFAGSYNGVYRSTDDGKSWTAITSPGEFQCLYTFSEHL
jgi:photosystem II stability/assembly factor-like uncharacterized protein